jgi:Na+/proline symporter
VDLLRLGRRAASDGIGFLPIYLGPTLMIALWWLVMRKIIRISKNNRITSLADFIASRYGKSALLGGLVTVIAVIGILPYISLQLKAISASYAILPALSGDQHAGERRGGAARERHGVLGGHDPRGIHHSVRYATPRCRGAPRGHGRGDRLRVAGEAAGVSCRGRIRHLRDVQRAGRYLFPRPRVDPISPPLLTPLEGVAGGYANWVWLTILSMLAIMFLPRQFQVAVVENKDERHLSKAIWLFPLYMIAINIFVLPIAFGGNLRFPGGSVDADTFVLTLPMGRQAGGPGAVGLHRRLVCRDGMVIVETIALSTMVCNDLVMPVLLRLRGLRLAERRDLTALLLGIRRGAIVLILLLGYLYFRLAGEAYALVSIGLVSFAAVAQFGPALLGGIFWKGGTRDGALWGLVAGFTVWAYTLLLPALVRSGWLPTAFLEHGPWGIALLKPLQLFGLAGLDQITHAMIWSMIANAGAYTAISLLGTHDAQGARQASVFVDAYRQAETPGASFWRGTASASELHRLLTRFIGAESADAAFREFARGRNLDWSAGALQADANLVHFVEMQLAGAIGAASAHIMVASAVKEEALTIEEVREMLDEASQVIVYSHRLEQKSRELERATEELRTVNERLKELDRLKDDFVATGIARAAHAAHGDPDFLADSARQPGPGSGGARASAGDRDQRKRAADAVDQPDPGHLEARVGQRGVAPRTGGHEGDRRGHGRGDERAVQGEARRAAHPHPGACAPRDRGPRPHGAGDAQSALECRQVLRSAAGQGRNRALGGFAVPARRRQGQWPGHRRSGPGSHFRQVPPGG